MLSSTVRAAQSARELRARFEQDPIVRAMLESFGGRFPKSSAGTRINYGSEGVAAASFPIPAGSRKPAKAVDSVHVEASAGGGMVTIK